jgi:hypothetical protein
MFASALNPFWWMARSDTATGPEPKPRRSTPVFIGDAIQPLGRNTVLLEIMRRDAERLDGMSDDQS